MSRKPLAGLQQPTSHAFDIRAEYARGAHAPPAGDHHRFDVGDVGVQRCSDRIMGWPGVKGAGVDDDQVRLHARLDPADPMGRPGVLAPSTVAHDNACLRVTDAVTQAAPVDRRRRSSWPRVRWWAGGPIRPASPPCGWVRYWSRVHSAPHTSQRGLPDVPVRVDQPRDDDAPGGIDDLGVVGAGVGIGDVEVRAHGADAVVVDECVDLLGIGSTGCQVIMGEVPTRRLGTGALTGGGETGESAQARDG
ncbi:hypothetical protein NFX46_23060 [Streptomyces phaeoluteigriseus]|uniref:Uncharacterized protein n=1 Tax=Streptomyces phaeoluteigriseus TaxID=114686 RepID=A0ABY4ZCP2_9ACTN|nr:hypothetical protein [Streptomyces phaeoluteigriseus]USQ86328.1 hypothetical protein NFX46_23060 [Streptomyces phaeoluteigriseus]